jgi:cytochrome b561
MAVDMQYAMTPAALRLAMPALVAAVGLLGLFRDASLSALFAPWINVLALFGALLLGLVTARFHWHVQHFPPAHAADIRDLSRRLSRTVYLVLYFLVGAKELFGPRRLETSPDLQAVLVYGLISLIAIRILAARLRMKMLSAPPYAKRSSAA